MASTAQGTAARGRQVAMDELRRRGAEVGEHRSGHVTYLTASTEAAGGSIYLRVRTRTAGTWQGSIRDGAEDPGAGRPDTYWLYVDLKSTPPSFYIVPDGWMRRDIHDAHEEYLQRHGGERAHSKDSLHHAIDVRRIAQWHDRWDLIGL